MEYVHRRKIRRRTRSSRQSQQSDAVVGSDDTENTVARQSDTVTEPEKGLGVLLENHEDLLLKVLSYVIEDGLHECRRVCKRWCEACKMMPVELQGKRLDKLHRVVDLFPEAVTLNVTGFFHGEYNVGRQLIPHLPRLKHLQTLILPRYTSVDAAGLMACLLSMDRLHSFSVRLGGYTELLDDVVPVLRRLRNLRSLSLCVPGHIWKHSDPITELKELKDLSLSVQLIINDRGELLFPSLAKLTRLYVFGFFAPGPCIFRIQSILQYAQTLQSLDVRFEGQFKNLSSVEEPPWKAFWRLSSFRVCSPYRENGSFFRSLQEMHHLTMLELSIEGKREQQPFEQCLSSLTKLRSLDLLGKTCRSVILPEIAGRLTILTKLTHLSLDPVRSGRFRRFPKNLLSLGLHIFRTLPTDFPRALLSVSTLTSLWISCRSNELCLFQRDGVTPTQFSKELSQLKYFWTENVLVDHLFLDALTKLTQLTQLHLGGLHTSVDIYWVCPQLSPLSNLKVLESTCRLSDDVNKKGLPQLCLPKLRELDLPLSNVDATKRQELLNTLPCLRKISLSRETLSFE